MSPYSTSDNFLLGNLGEAEAVRLLRDLFWSECYRLRIPLNRVNMPDRTKVPDGGIDASIENGADGDLIFDGLCRYQVKSGSAFKGELAELKTEVSATGEDVKNHPLKPLIKELLDKDGHYILVCFGYDFPYQKTQKIENDLVTIFKAANYSNPKVKVWGQNKILAFLSRYPTIRARLLGLPNQYYQTHESWSSDTEMERPIQLGDKQKEIIEEISKKLLNEPTSPNLISHARLLGEPGIGKTRMALEATKSKELASQVAYFTSPENLLVSPIYRDLLQHDNYYQVILVIDECSDSYTAEILNKLNKCGPRVKLITIYNEFVGSNSSRVEVQPLTFDQILAIITGYIGVSRDQINDEWIEICGGSPRVAHVIGENLRKNPRDLLKSADTVRIWDRYIANEVSTDTEEFRKRKKFLSYLALFKRFGYSGKVAGEARAIAGIIDDHQIKIGGGFNQLVKIFQDRKVLQGTNTLYITPKALHLWLWLEWWDEYGHTFEWEPFKEKLDGQLLSWFNEMFIYASNSLVASQVVRRLLGSEGPFHNSDYLTTELGADFFLALSEADTDEALYFLQNYFKNSTKEDLLSFKTGRRQVVMALEKIAVWRRSFSGAARLLLALAEAENETWTNNASGVFAGLFSLGVGVVAPTEASPQERMPVLIDALKSESKQRRLLGIKACDRALDIEPIKVGRPDLQGIKVVPNLWRPATAEEGHEAFRTIWQLVVEYIEKFSEPDERELGAEVLFNNTRSILRFPTMQNMVITSFRNLVSKNLVDRQKLIATITRVLRYEGRFMSSEDRQEWIAFRDEVSGTSFSAQMVRFVKNSHFEDQYDENGKLVNVVDNIIKELAKEALTNPDLLKSESSWLFTEQAQRGYLFGYELGKADIPNDFSLLESLMEEQKLVAGRSGAYTLGGYLRSLYEHSTAKWEEIIERISNTPGLQLRLTELVARSGMSEKIARLILERAKHNIIKTEDFFEFLYRPLEGIPPQLFEEWLEFLGQPASTINSVFAALVLFEFYYLHPKSTVSFPEQLTFRLLTNPALQTQKVTQQKAELTHLWTEIANRFLKAYPQHLSELITFVLAEYGENQTVFDGFNDQINSFLYQFLKQNPTEVWTQISKFLGPPFDKRAFKLREFLRGSDLFSEKLGPLSFIPLDELWGWIDADVEKRARLIAEIVPRNLEEMEGKPSLIREMLIRYGHLEQVRSGLGAAYITEGWTGPASQHYIEKQRILKEFANRENHPNITLWVTDFNRWLDQQIQQEQIDEERDD